MSILTTARALLALLQPLTGERASGTATVRAVPGPTAVLPHNSYAVPLVGGDMRFDLLLRVDRNPAVASPGPYDWTVAAAGTAVTMTSVVGGLDVNLPLGTEIRWWPSVDGVEPKSILASALTGGTQTTGLASLRQVGFFEQFRADVSGAAADLFRSMASRFPAAVLVWEGSGPADGDSVSPLEQRGARVGRGMHLYAHQWDLFVITSRQDGDPQRREEGLTLVDAITEEMVDRQNVDGINFSAPTGVQITQRRRWLVAPTFYVYLVRFTTVSSVKQRDRRTWNPWAKTRLDIDTPDVVPFPMVDNNLINMP